MLKPEYIIVGTVLETPHVAVGAAIATKIPNPWVGIPLCLVSHFVLDKVPHWNPHTYTETQKYGYPTKKTFAIAMADISLGLGLGLAWAYLVLPDTRQAWYVIACCFVSVAPDVSKYPFFVFKRMRKGLMKKWVDYERSLQADTSFVPGMLTQLATIAAAIWWSIS